MRKTMDYFWLFPETAKGIYEFSGYQEDYLTKNNKKLDILILLGQDKNELTGDFALATFNIENWNMLLKQLGDNQEKWIGRKFSVSESKINPKKLVLTLEQ